jgi:hypothetical protein
MKADQYGTPDPSREEGRAHRTENAMNDDDERPNNTESENRQVAWGLGYRLTIGRARIGSQTWMTPGELPWWEGPRREKPWRLIHHNLFTTPETAARAYHDMRDSLTIGGISSPERIIRPARLTPLAAASAEGQAFARELRVRRVPVPPEPLIEHEPGEFDWVDWLFPLPPVLIK